MSTELAVIIVGAVPTVAGIVTAALSGKSNQRLKGIEKDMAICKDASYSALEAHVKNGSNGNVKRSYLRLRKSLFDIPEEDKIED